MSQRSSPFSSPSPQLGSDVFMPASPPEPPEPPEPPAPAASSPAEPPLPADPPARTAGNGRAIRRVEQHVWGQHLDRARRHTRRATDRSTPRGTLPSLRSARKRKLKPWSRRRSKAGAARASCLRRSCWSPERARERRPRRVHAHPQHTSARSPVERATAKRGGTGPAELSLEGCRSRGSSSRPGACRRTGGEPSTRREPGDPSRAPGRVEHEHHACGDRVLQPWAARSRTHESHAPRPGSSRGARGPEKAR